MSVKRSSQTFFLKIEQQRFRFTCEGQKNTLADFVSLVLERNFPFNSAGLSRKRPRY